MMMEKLQIVKLEEQMNKYLGKEKVVTGVLGDLLPNKLKIDSFRLVKAEENIYNYKDIYLTGGRIKIDGDHIGEEVVRFAILEETPGRGESFTLFPKLKLFISIDTMTGTSYDSMMEKEFEFTETTLDSKKYEGTMLKHIVEMFKKYF